MFFRFVTKHARDRQTDEQNYDPPDRIAASRGKIEDKKRQREMRCISHRNGLEYGTQSVCHQAKVKTVCTRVGHKMRPTRIFACIFQTI